MLTVWAVLYMFGNRFRLAEMIREKCLWSATANIMNI